MLTSLRVVKAFGQEEREHARFMTRASEGVRARLRLAFAEGAFGVLNKGIVAAGTAAVLYVGASHVRAGIISLGDLLLIVGYVAMLYDPISTIASKVTKMQSSIVSAERAFALLDQAPDVAERPGAVPLGRALGEVRCEGVSFRYRDGPLALADLSFEVPPGSRVGILGATGAGKTTLVSLLTRFTTRPTGGSSSTASTSVTTAWRTCATSSRSCSRNRCCSRPRSPRTSRTPARTPHSRPSIEAAKSASAHDFIWRCPYGYDTIVGERG